MGRAGGGFYLFVLSPLVGLALFWAAAMLTKSSAIFCERAATGVHCELREKFPGFSATVGPIVLESAYAATHETRRAGRSRTARVLVLNGEVVGASDADDAADRLNEVLEGKRTSVALDPLAGPSYGWSLALASIGALLFGVVASGLFGLRVEAREARKRAAEHDWVDEALGRKP
ncbi:MAG: hypothetical protein M3020_17015 [Myxococcota bacterium]|nr:hypothetical protein [Myxococcota bacterium]